MAQTGRRPRSGNPDVVLKLVVGLAKREAERLQARQDLPVACPTCGIDPCLTPEERRFVLQALRDLGRLSLAARRQMLEDVLRKLSDEGLDRIEEAAEGRKWLTEA
jgi:hypothetical protein